MEIYITFIKASWCPAFMHKEKEGGFSLFCYFSIAFDSEVSSFQSGIFWSSIFRSPLPVPALAGLAPSYSEHTLNVVLGSPEGTSLVPLFIMVLLLHSSEQFPLSGITLPIHYFSSLFSSHSIRVEKLHIICISLSSLPGKTSHTIQRFSN